MVLDSSQMLAAEQAAFARGSTAEALMDEAAAGIFNAVRQFLPEPGTALVYLGTGNNAGDALVVARHLLAAGWRVMLCRVRPDRKFKDLPARHWENIHQECSMLEPGGSPGPLSGSLLIIDGILGIGATASPLDGAIAEVVQHMNTLRRERHAFTLAIDLPTGLGAGDVHVEADLTVTIGFPKQVLLDDTASSSVGRLAIVPLRALSEVQGDSSRRVLTAGNLLPSLPCRSFEFHKGLAGRVGVIAGSRGFLGAAALAASGALRGGAGLVTLYVTDDLYPLVSPLLPPEIMVKPVRRLSDALLDPLDAIAVGPGLGADHDEAIIELLARAEDPVVVDADALNALARRGLDVLKQNSAPRLLTPHPGEMARLAAHFPAWQTLGRSELCRAFTREFPHATLLLKGARTVVAADGNPLSFNSTGNPGMASGGMGDVLTGLCAALAGQGVSLYESACLGAWLSGRAAERAIFNGPSSQESLAAGDVLHHLGGAFCDLKRLAW
jgi:NAD(P)H-hydrate epimerase